MRPRTGISSFAGALSRYSRELCVAAVLLLLLSALAVLAPSFYQAQPLLSLAAREAPTLLVACGMALLLVSRQIDISVGSQFAVCSVTTGLLLAAKWPLLLAAGAGVGLGAALGGFNGLLVAGLRLPAIVVTLAGMVGWREGLRWARQGLWVDLPDGVQWLGLRQAAGQCAVIGLALLLFVALAWASRHLAAGRFLFAVGANSEAARLAGISPRLTTFAAFVLMGALTGLAAVMNVVQSPQVDPNCGTGLELKAIAAAVVGGIAVSGGRGRLWGVLAGLLLLACVSPALTHFRVEPHWERAIYGAIILVAVAAEGLRGRKQTANFR
jgi:rhamnose transport system permease protein